MAQMNERPLQNFAREITAKDQDWQDLAVDEQVAHKVKDLIEITKAPVAKPDLNAYCSRMYPTRLCWLLTESSAAK